MADRWPEEEVRPFFGERSEPVGAVPPRSQPQPARTTFEERRRLRLLEGLCPACATPVDEGACPCCGWTLAKERETEWVREDPPDWLPTFPLALFRDEYGPANVDDEVDAA